MFDQWELISDVVDELYPDLSEEEKEDKNSIDFHDMLRWGVVYYPNACVDAARTKGCKMQLVVHGCTMNAYDMVKEWAPVASANEIIMVFPQTDECWAAENTQSGFHNTFMRRIIDRVTGPIDSDHEYVVPVDD